MCQKLQNLSSLNQEHQNLTLLTSRSQDFDLKSRFTYDNLKQNLKQETITFNKDKFEKALQQTFYYKKNIIQYPQQESYGFQSFKKILNDLELKTKIADENQQFQKNVDDILIYNKEQQSFFEDITQKSMRQTFSQAKNLYQNFNDNADKLKKKIKLKKPINNVIIPEKNRILKIDVKQTQSQTCYAQTKRLIGPPTLQNCTLTFHDKDLYLFGGISCQINKYIFQLDLFQWKWESIGSIQTKIIEPMYGHQSIYSDGNIYIIGGQLGFHKKLKIRYLNSELIQYNILNNQLKSIKISGFIQRRNFAAALVGNKYIMVYGGIDYNNNFISEPQFLNLGNILTFLPLIFKNIKIILKILKLFLKQGDTQVWESHRVENDVDGKKGIAFNAIVYIQRADYKINDLFSSHTDYKQDQVINNIQYDCVFAFGGKSQDNSGSGQLKYMILKNKNLKWSYVQSLGNMPSERYSHTMNYCQDIQGIVIFGGFDIQLQQPSNELFIYKIQSMNWVKVNINSNSIESRYDHCSEIVNSSLIIFGGHDLNKFKNSDLQIIELNEEKANQKMLLRNENELTVLSDVQNINQMLKSQVAKNTIKQRSRQKPSFIKDIISFQPIPTRQFLSQQGAPKKIDLI